MVISAKGECTSKMTEQAGQTKRVAKKYAVHFQGHNLKLELKLPLLLRTSTPTAISTIPMAIINTRASKGINSAREPRFQRCDLLVERVMEIIRENEEE